MNANIYNMNDQTQTVKMWLDAQPSGITGIIETAAEQYTGDNNEKAAVVNSLAKQIEATARTMWSDNTAGPWRDILTKACNGINWHQIAELMILDALDQQ